MKERPILFSGPMIRALLAGTKTQTRRVVKLPHQNPLGRWEASTLGGAGCVDGAGVPVSEHAVICHTRTGDVIGCPYGGPGDLLWVRETWGANEGAAGGNLYKADIGAASSFYRADLKAGKWTHSINRWSPSIHMPRKVSRLTLRITDVRAERLQKISEADAESEGATWHNGRGIGYSGFRHDPNDGFVWDEARTSFAHLWNRINGDGSWAANPYVWALTFEVIRENVDAVLARLRMSA